MVRSLRKFLILPAFVVAAAGTVGAQTHNMSAMMTKDELTSFAKVQVAITQAHDSADLQFAQARNKKPEAQEQLQDKLRTEVAAILQKNGLTDADYQKKIFVISTDSTLRRSFDTIIAQLTGAPTPGLVAAAPTVKVPDGMVGTHIGHVVNSFSDTPNKMGLLPVALAEARTAATHAALAQRTPTNLDMMKLHAGHVINAIDPTIMPMGPGLGYGVKKATLGVQTHIELAAKVPGASQNVILHAGHVSMSSKNTLERCDQAVSLAQRIQSATTADEAAKLLSQLVSVTSQLVAGADANGDGRITWEMNEGGLQQAADHMQLMLAAEGSTTGGKR
jgi:hypothetical protein